MLRRAWLIGSWLAVVAASPTVAQDALGECYDVFAEARIVQQTYTEYPDCGDGCIVMRWPWLLDLDIRRVRQGSLPTGEIRVQSLQHAHIRQNRVWRVWLRRNTVGGYNLVGLGARGDMERCPEGSKPARAYLGRRS